MPKIEIETKYDSHNSDVRAPVVFELEMWSVGMYIDDRLIRFSRNQFMQVVAALQAMDKIVDKVD